MDLYDKHFRCMEVNPGEKEKEPLLSLDTSVMSFGILKNMKKMNVSWLN